MDTAGGYGAPVDQPLQERGQYLHQFRIGLYASKEYLAQHGAPKRKADLDEHGFVEYIDNLIEIGAVRWLADIVTPRNTVFRSSSVIAQ